MVTSYCQWRRICQNTAHTLLVLDTSAWSLLQSCSTEAENEYEICVCSCCQVKCPTSEPWHGATFFRSSPTEAILVFDVVKARVCDGTLMFTMMRNVDGCSLDRRITKSRYTQRQGLMMANSGVPYCNTQLSRTATPKSLL